MATGTEAAEKAYRSAEERFLAGDLDGALQSCRNAKRHFASFPALQKALAAYEVHAAARRDVGNWRYAVLGLRPGDQPVTHDTIKKQYRLLCLTLHPDKNPSAAADGAFKLLQRAWEALSARHPPGSRPAPAPKPPSPPFNFEEWWRDRGATPPQPFSSSFNFDGWRATYARAKGTTYCGHCDPEPAGEGGHRAPRGGRCHSCGARFDQPRQSGAEGATAPPPPGTGAAPPPRDPPPPPERDAGEKFPCPAECSRCGARFSSLVSPGMCKLRCQACSYGDFVYVYSRDRATAF